MIGPTAPSQFCLRFLALPFAFLTLVFASADAQDVPPPHFAMPGAQAPSGGSTGWPHLNDGWAGERLSSRLSGYGRPIGLNLRSRGDDLWASTDLPFPNGAPRLAYAATIHRWAREYAAGSWLHMDEGDRRLDAVATLALDGSQRDTQILWNLQQGTGTGQEFGVGFVATERDNLSNAALVLKYRSEAENGVFMDVWVAATVTSPDIGEGAAGRLTFGIDRPQTGVSLTIDHYTSDYFPAARLTGSHLPGTWGISFDVSHVLSWPTGPLNEIYLLLTPYYRALNSGQMQSRGFDLLLSASSFEADSSIDIFYSQATYLTRRDPWSAWSEDYSEDWFVEATASFCNSCRWRPALTFSDAEFSALAYRQATLSLQYEVNDKLTATASNTWLEEVGVRSERQELLLRWRPSHRVSAIIGAQTSEGKFDRARLKIDAHLSHSVHTTVSAWINNDGVGLSGDLIKNIGHGAAIRGTLDYDSQGDAEIGAQITWRF